MVGDFGEFSTDRSLAVVRFDPAKILPDYGFALVTSHAFQVQMQQHSVGTAQPHLFLGDIRRIKAAVPPISEQQRVLEVLQQLASAQDTIVCNLSELRKLREQISLACLENAYV
jgi:restriction endonuclease S subunit